MVAIGFISDAQFIQGAPSGRPVNSELLRSFGGRLGVVELIGVR